MQSNIECATINRGTGAAALSFSKFNCMENSERTKMPLNYGLIVTKDVEYYSYKTKQF